MPPQMASHGVTNGLALLSQLDQIKVEQKFTLLEGKILK